MRVFRPNPILLNNGNIETINELNDKFKWYIGVCEYLLYNIKLNKLMNLIVNISPLLLIIPLMIYKYLDNNLNNDILNVFVDRLNIYQKILFCIFLIPLIWLNCFSNLNFESDYLDYKDYFMRINKFIEKEYYYFEKNTEITQNELINLDKRYNNLTNNITFNKINNKKIKKIDENIFII